MDARLRAISNFSITDKCNGRCKMCNIWNTEPRPEPHLEQIESFFQENKETLKDLTFIQLTGGEPFLRTDLPEIVEIVHNAVPDTMIWIPTNGLLPDEIRKTTRLMLNKIEGAKLGITVSLDGDAQVNDAQRGVVDGFKNAVKTIKNLSELKEKHGLGLTTGFTLTDENYVYAPIVQKIAYRLGSDFSFRPINFSEHYYKNTEQQDALSPEQIIPYLDYIAINLKNQKGVLRSVTNLAYINGAKNFIKGDRSLTCSAASESVYIDTVGDVYPCLVMNQRLGNIYQNSLEDILASPSAWEARERIQNLDCPNCWLECEVYRDLIKDRKRLFDAFLWGVTLSS
ncbi:MAG: radical SAM protein [Candidatus Bathyarchaeota archaeon]|nr:radical SAM protein [Candidatus Bathyarchaeota archaeon]